MSVIFAILFLAAVPAPLPKAKSPPVPKVERFVLPMGETNWGYFDGYGKDFTIEGHPSWDAIVQVRKRKDGSTWLWVLWTLKSNGDACPGVYWVVDGELHGVWGYGSSVQVDADGQMTGSFYDDRIYKLLPEKK